MRVVRRSPSAPSSRVFWLGLTLILLVFLVQGLVLARLLVPSHDESNFLFVSYLAVTSRIGLFDDSMVGHRVPLPYYVFGVTQVLSGPSLLAARALGVGFGLALVLLTGLLARRLGGTLCGLLAAAILTAQGAVVAYYSMGDYHALLPLVMIAGLSVWLSGDSATRNVAGAAILGSLFFMRSHVWPLLPPVLLYSVWRARAPGERLLAGSAVIAPPLVFFLWDPRHLKILASVPLVGGLVRPLGYVPFVLLDARPYRDLEYQIDMLIRLGRRYEFLALLVAVTVLAVARRIRRTRGGGPFLADARVNLVAAIFVYMLGWFFVMFRINFKWIGMYFASLMPLLAVLLAWLWSRLAADPAVSPRARALSGAFLAAVLLLPIYYNRNPLIPTGELRAADPVRAVSAAGVHLARVVSREARVFLFGAVDVYYFSGLPPTWIQQITNYDTLAVRDEDNWATMRSGYYGMPQVERWLGIEADYAVISPEALNVFAEGFHGHPEVNRPKVARIRALLAERFEQIDRVAEYPYYSYEVYRRVSRAEPGRPGAAPSADGEGAPRPRGAP